MFEGLSNRFTEIQRKLTGKNRISEKNIEEAVDSIQTALLEADVNLRVVRRFINRTRRDALGQEVLSSVNPGQQFIKIVHDRLAEFLGAENAALEMKGPDTLSVMLLMGLQGSGKTTTSAKLGHMLQKEGRKVLLCAADLLRPAAVEQLKTLGAQNNIDVFAEEGAKNPLDVVKKALKKAEKEAYSNLIIDTSGRLQVDEKLMKELKQIRQTANPQESLLVADAMTGQNAVEIAKEFDEQIEISGIVLSKFDSDTRGGAALSIKSITGKAIKLIGVGEKIEDLERFYPDRMAGRILGMGDVVSLVEKAQDVVDQKKAEKLQKKMAKATFTLSDYLDQFSQLRKMGNIESLVKMIPGAEAAMAGQDMDENMKKMKKEEAIILSMTLKERENHRIINPSRKRRIAKGSGTSVFAVNKLIKNFEKTRLMMKKMMRNKKAQSEMLSMLGGN